MGNDGRSLSVFLLCPYFNPRSRVGNDDSGWVDIRAAYLFQSTFPRGERPVVRELVIDVDDFNPRSRVGNDRVYKNYFSWICISIHVPAWGTTVHTITLMWEYSNFNPRSRVGNDGT